MRAPPTSYPPLSLRMCVTTSPKKRTLQRQGPSLAPILPVGLVEFREWVGTPNCRLSKTELIATGVLHAWCRRSGLYSSLKVRQERTQQDRRLCTGSSLIQSHLSVLDSSYHFIYPPIHSTTSQYWNCTISAYTFNLFFFFRIVHSSTSF